MNDGPPADAMVLAAIAERLDALAETADLMGDPDGAQVLREQASSRRLQAMTILDRWASAPRARSDQQTGRPPRGGGRRR